MTAGLLPDAAERFALGTHTGFTPTAESVSDTALTPFGLTLRTIPIPCIVVPVRSSDGDETATEKVTTQSTDGSDEGDTRADIIDD